MNTWDDMEFWKSKEWQIIQERLDGLDKSRIPYNPSRELLFAALDATPYDRTRVAIIGQDPYPSSSHATGIAFSVRKGLKVHPPTLINILKEYESDLTYPWPAEGDLTPWCEQGVLLWNSIPTCETGKAASHRWPEWEYLTKEIVEKLNEQQIVFAFLGSIAHNYSQYTDRRSEVICIAHPSPRASLRAFNPFVGSRIFSTINVKLKDQGLPMIDWRLP